MSTVSQRKWRMELELERPKLHRHVVCCTPSQGLLSSRRLLHTVTRPAVVSCRAVAYYKWLDSEKRVDWVNIQEESDRLAVHGVEFDTAMQRIHGLDRHGSLLVGVPAFLAVWEVLPYWNILPPIVRAVPWAMPLVDAAYAWWAKHRLGISSRMRALEEASACRKP